MEQQKTSKGIFSIISKGPHDYVLEVKGKIEELTENIRISGHIGTSSETISMWKYELIQLKKEYKTRTGKEYQEPEPVRPSFATGSRVDNRARCFFSIH